MGPIGNRLPTGGPNSTPLHYPPKGAVNSELIHHAVSEWGVDERQARNYLHEARQVVIDDVNHDRKIVVAEMVHMMKAVMKEGFRTGQLNSVIGAANTLSRVAKLDR